MFKRRQTKRIVDMTNQEASDYYVHRAQAAIEHGNSARANRLFQSAILHDPGNVEAQQGFEATHQPRRPVPTIAGGESSTPPRHHHRPWWKKLLGVR